MAGLVGYRDQVGATPDKTRNNEDIRRFIAQSQTAQMDPNKFPRGEYQRYPLMILNPEGKPYCDKVGRAIVVRNADEEEAFHEEHKDAQRVRDPEDTNTELVRLREENARLKAGKAGEAEDDDSDAGKEPKVAATKPNTVSGLTKPANKPAAKGPAPGSKLD